MANPVCTLEGNLRGITPATAEDQADSLFTVEMQFRQAAAVTTTTAIAELSIGQAKRKMRLVAAYLNADAAITANGTNFNTLIISKRLAVDATRTTAVSWATDTPTTDDVAAWARKSLLPGFTTTEANLIFAEGDSVTFELTKGGSITFPAAIVTLRFKMLDA